MLVSRKKICATLCVLLITTIATPVAWVSWEAPQQRVNGNQLPASELAGYRLRILSGAGANDEEILLLSPLVTSYTWADPAPGDFEISVTAVDQHGFESLPSMPLLGVIN